MTNTALNLRSILSVNLAGVATGEKPQVLDEEGRALLCLAPNAIEWCTGPEWCGATDLYEFQRSYQMIRDYFELRCPNCNPGGTDPGQPGDCWSKSRTYLESETLLVWNPALLDDECPKCRTTRSDFIESKRFHGYNQMHCVAGMRCVSTNTYVFSSRGMLTLSELMGGLGSGLAKEISLEVVDRHKTANAAMIGNAGMKFARRISTVDGYVIDAAPEHRFWTKRFDGTMAWLRAEDLKVNDELMLRSGENLWGELALSKSTAQHYGYTSRTRAAGYVNAEVPRAIRESNRSTVLEYLRALLPPKTQQFKTPSKTFALQIQLLFLNLGGLTRVTERNNFFIIDFTRSTIAQDAAQHSSSTTSTHVTKIESLGPMPMADLSVPDTESYAANGVVTHNSGKSITAALIGTYSEHVFLTLGHTYPGGIHGYFGITPVEKFEITFLAASQVQGEDTIWAKFKGYRSMSPWFRRYIKWIGDEEKRQTPLAAKMERWRYEEQTAKIINQHPSVKLDITAKNSNSAGQAGRTRVHGFLDELDRMNQSDSRLSADEVYRTIENGLQTIRSRSKLYGCLPWFGSMISVTSPMTRAGKAMELLRQADEIPDMFARHYATWNFNPKEPRENFESKYRKDPVGAERDFGANPPGAEHPLIHDEVRWATLAINAAKKPQATFEYYRRADQLGNQYIAAKLKWAERHYDRRLARFVVFDAGKNFDCFSGVAAHGEWRAIRNPDGTRADRLVTVYDWVIRIVPEPGTEVWFDSVFDVIKALKAFQSTAFVVFDHWNSVQIIQQIRDLGIPAEQEALSNQDFVDWKINCFEHAVEMLPPALSDIRVHGDSAWRLPFEFNKSQADLQPESAAIAELVELQCDPDTKKVYNPHKGEERGVHSDDTARICVHVHKLVQRAGFTDKFDDRSVRAARKRAEHGSSQWGMNRGQVAHGAAASAVRNWNKNPRGW